MRNRAEGKLVLRCHMERRAKSPSGHTYRVAIDRRGILLGNGRLAMLTLPIGWLLHRSRWPGQWWLTVSRPPHRREYLQWRLTNIWSFGPYEETKARQELSRLVGLIEAGDWFEGGLNGPPPSAG